MGSTIGLDIPIHWEFMTPNLCECLLSFLQTSPVWKVWKVCVHVLCARVRVDKPPSHRVVIDTETQQLSKEPGHRSHNYVLHIYIVKAS